MRFWQALVVAQLTAGSVYADRYPAGLHHFAVEGGALLIGAIMWVVLKWTFGPSHQPNVTTEDR
ncbi:hypothetical protein [Novosphingobium sp. JCM 18896]|uniref:hypothetical protein n=1 Tax=Novosphingobium sp. JCM 18896 TaxID=2989731 RepID=UPI0022224A6B|nr:hypothetical protein [Novosphingobium sp. JCM 18896]MCW1431420.1 hypothetical protein [Novosphingobium sp. JCM 18896]